MSRDKLTRRDAIRLAGTAAAGLPMATLGGHAPAHSPDAPPGSGPGAARTFPDGFYWGAATSAYQIEAPLPSSFHAPSI